MKKVLDMFRMNLGRIADFRNYKNFDSAKYWDERYKGNGNSGAGSYNKLAKFKADVVNDFIDRKGIKTVVEWGVGDGNQLLLMNYAEYVGIDVSRTAVNHCREMFKNNEKRKFVLYNGERKKTEVLYEMAISLDVIYHLVEDTVFETYMENLFASSKKYVCIYSSNYNYRQTAHVRHRKITTYICENYPEWKLVKYKKNIYPINKWKPNDPTTSFADFYFYRKMT